MERLTKRITENQIELSAKANPTQYVNSPQRVHVKHPFWNVFNRLCEYEQLEEQGLLITLPCKLNEMVYIAHKKYPTHKGLFVSKADIVSCLEEGYVIGSTKEEALQKLKELENV